jgi:hypothetical protein
VKVPEPFPTSLCDSHPQLCQVGTPNLGTRSFLIVSLQALNSKTLDVIELIQSRNEMLATIPLPDNAPDMTLSPITLPPQATLHEFLNTAPSSLRTECVTGICRVPNLI